MPLEEQEAAYHGGLTPEEFAEAIELDLAVVREIEDYAKRRRSRNKELRALFAEVLNRARGPGPFVHGGIRYLPHRDCKGVERTDLAAERRRLPVARKTWGHL